ncbi:MAG: indole-3-glycerol phosphate synthase TrpC [Gemmatimonadota bacterium]|nr:indole-3-glycerol phosphate synthase TrpC [Gemmatimonadota bacterium]
MSILNKIIEDKKEEVAELERAQPLGDLKKRLADLPRGAKPRFAEALKSTGRSRVALIAEIKKASPSAGVIREDFDPPALAAAYSHGGADALSVLTDKKYFQGADSYLRQAKDASGLPVLRKDFTVSAWQLYHSRLLGADCVLLIAAALEREFLEELTALAEELSLDALVEVHNEAELEIALDCNARLLGVNNRNLKTFATSIEVSARLAGLFPHSVVRVSESGIKTHGDVKRLGSLGYDAVLVGEQLMREPDVAAAAKNLMQGDT